MEFVKCRAKQQEPTGFQKQVLCDYKFAASTPWASPEVEHELGTLHLPSRAVKVPLIKAVGGRLPLRHSYIV